MGPAIFLIEMRVIGGSKKGRKLFWPAHHRIRPMRDMVRSALFNILSDVVENSRFLDLFAGTGSVGIEALSRGAKHCVFVDNSSEAIKLIHKNLEALGFKEKAFVLKLDVFEAIERLAAEGERFDLIFIGPPYYKGLAHKTLTKLSEHTLLDKGGIIVTEIFKKEELDAQYGELALMEEHQYGDNRLLFYKGRG